MNNKRNIILGVILLAVIASGIFILNRQSNLEGENEQLSMQVDSLILEKEALLVEFEAIQMAFAEEESRADSLSTVLAEVQEEIAKRNVAAQKIKKQNTTEVNALKKEIEQLRQLYSETESYVTELRNENAVLLAQNLELTENVKEMQTENDQLVEKGMDLEASNTQLEKSVEKYKRASVKASGFQINTDKKSGKLTTSAKKVRNIHVSFDMNNIPPEYQKDQTLYLVISDEMGVPVKVANPIRVRLKTNDGVTAELEAQQEQKVKLEANQRIEFIQEFESKLKAGKYKATVYSEMGLLGSSSFNLR